MQWQLLLTGFALFLIFEGLAPFAMPRAWRRAIARMASMSDDAIRVAGGITIAAGLILLVSVTGN
ncbi:MAG: DUF2065 domain-containing protein [Pseudomonadota bacterium]